MSDETTTQDPSTEAHDIEVAPAEALTETTDKPIEALTDAELEAATAPEAPAEAPTDAETTAAPAPETGGEAHEDAPEHDAEAPAATDGNTEGEVTHPEDAPAVSQPTHEVSDPEAERPADAPPVPGNEPGLDDETTA